MFYLDFSVCWHNPNIEQVLESEDASSKHSSTTYYLQTQVLRSQSFQFGEPLFKNTKLRA